MEHLILEVYTSLVNVKEVSYLSHFGVKIVWPLREIIHKWTNLRQIYTFLKRFDEKRNAQFENTSLLGHRGKISFLQDVSIANSFSPHSNNLVHLYPFVNSTKRKTRFKILCVENSTLIQNYFWYRLTVISGYPPLASLPVSTRATTKQPSWKQPSLRGTP